MHRASRTVTFTIFDLYYTACSSVCTEGFFISNQPYFIHRKSDETSNQFHGYVIIYRYSIISSYEKKYAAFGRWRERSTGPQARRQITSASSEVFLYTFFLILPPF